MNPSTRASGSRQLLSRRALTRGAAGGLAVASLGRLAERAAGQAATPTASPAAAAPATATVGSFTVTAVLDGLLTFPNPAFDIPITAVYFADAPEAELEAALRATGRDAWLDSPQTATETGSITPLVIDTGDHLVLVDTGVGPASPFPGAGLLTEALAQAGIEPGAIDTVFFTHAHADHVLGAVDASGAPAFPNARYVMARGEFRFWTDPEQLVQIFPDEETAAAAGGAFLGILPTIEDRLELVDEAAEEEIVPGVRAVAAYGHSPGHAAVAVESAGERLLIAGDAFIHPLHVSYPDWNFAFDTLPSQTDTTRRGLFHRAVEEGALVHGYHLPFPGFGRIGNEGDRFVWQPAG